MIHENSCKKILLSLIFLEFLEVTITKNGLKKLFVAFGFLSASCCLSFLFTARFRFAYRPTERYRKPLAFFS